MDVADNLKIPDAPRTGDEVGPYRLVEELGSGGMGKVFLAEHRRLGRRVALKMLQPELWHNARSVQRFFQEARLVNRIDHENIVEIYDFVQEDDGLSYLIMELLVGNDLTHERKRNGPFPLARAVLILRQIAAGLAAAHNNGVVHRDLKPGNIFVVEKGKRHDFVKLLDFGIAKLQEVDLEGPHTRTGAIVGTPLYMSPEQASGEKVDARSDLYSLGVVAFWMLSDAFPFKAKSFAELLRQQQTGRPADLPRTSPGGETLPPALIDIVKKCLQRDPAARYQTASELEAALAEVVPILAQPAQAAAAAPGSPALPPGPVAASVAAPAAVPAQGETAKPAPLTLRLPAWLNKRQLLHALGGLLGLLIVALGYWVFFRRPPPSPAPRPQSTHKRPAIAPAAAASSPQTAPPVEPKRAPPSPGLAKPAANAERPHASTEHAKSATKSAKKKSTEPPMGDDDVLDLPHSN